MTTQLFVACKICACSFVLKNETYICDSCQYEIDEREAIRDEAN